MERLESNPMLCRQGITGSTLYQHFPSKNALLSAIIEREVAPLLGVNEELANIQSCDVALQCYIRASVRHQMRRPHLARLVDIAEKREMFNDQVSSTRSRLQAVVENIRRLPDARSLAHRSVAAADLLAIIRSLLDAAGERGEGESVQLVRRVAGAVWGHLR